jgi:hypothetical protein
MIEGPPGQEGDSMNTRSSSQPYKHPKPLYKEMEEKFNNEY